MYYKILADGIVISESNNAETVVINPVVNLEVNSSGSFSFTFPAEHPNIDSISIKQTVVTVYKMDELIFQGYCVEESVDFYLQKTIICEGELAYLNDSIQRQVHYQNETPLSLLTKYIAVHNSQVENKKKFTVGTVTVSDPNNSVNCFTNYNPTMQEIKEDLVDDLGGYIRIRYADNKKYIDYLAESPRQSTQDIELGVNLVNYKSNIDNTEIATAIIPLGATLEDQKVAGLDAYVDITSVNSGLDYIANATAVQNFGWIYRTVTWNNVTVPQNLKTKAQKYLSEVQFNNVVIEVNAIDLAMISNNAPWRLLDSIRVKSTPHGMDKVFMLTKATYNLNNPESDTFTLGHTERQSLTAKTNAITEETLKRIEQLPNKGFLQNAIDSATSQITGAEGGFVKINYNSENQPYELLVMDTDDIATARKVWRFNQNGLGYSSTGYNGEYGLAMTQDGAIVADFITTGTLDAYDVDIVNLQANQIHVNNSTVDVILNDIETGKNSVYRGTGIPSASTYPENEWTTPEEKEKHDGDIFYSDNGYVYTYEYGTLFDNADALYDGSIALDVGQWIIWDDKFEIKETINDVQFLANENKLSIVETKETLENDYSTTTETRSLIDQKADSIELSVSQNYVNNDKIKDYSTTEQMNSSISVEVGNVRTEVNKKFESYSTTAEVQSLIETSEEGNRLYVGEKIDEIEVGSRNIILQSEGMLGITHPLYTHYLVDGSDELTLDGNKLAI